MNANALIELDTLKQFLGITTNDKDLILEMYIESVSDYIQGNGESILATDYTEKLKGTDTQNILLSHRPINSIESLKIDGTLVDDYEIYKSSGIVYRDGGFPISGSSNLMSGAVTKIKKNIEITYNAGYATIPSDLKLLVCELVKSQLEHDSNKSGLKSYDIDDVSKTWDNSEKVLTRQQSETFNKYKAGSVHV